jgi:hypothetical protein
MVSNHLFFFLIIVLLKSKMKKKKTKEERDGFYAYRRTGNLKRVDQKFC